MPRFSETLTFVTPLGHEVMAEMDYERGELTAAKVVHTHTGVISPLGKACRESLERALRARQVYEHAVSETEALEHTLQGFTKLAAHLGDTHPALKPYHYEAAQHRQIAKDMRFHADHYYATALQAIDKIAEK